MNDLRQKGDCDDTIGRDVSVAGMRLVETVYRPGSRPQHHQKAVPSFTLVVAGRYTELGCPERVCAPPAVLFHPAEDIHAGGFDDRGGKAFGVELEPSWLSRHGWSGCDTPVSYHDGGRPAWLMVAMYREFHLLDGVSSLALEGLALDLVAATSRLAVQARRNGKSGWLEQVEGLLREHLAAPLRMSEIAATVGVHPVSLARAFHRRFGLSAGEYARVLRVEQASRQLAASDRAVAEIASAAGFANKSHLTRTFKFLTGMTPREYRSVFRPPRRHVLTAPPGAA